MTSWTDETKEQALDIYAEHGPAEAAKQTGVPYRTVHRWARKANLSYATAKKEHVERLTRHRAELAERLYTEAGQLLDQLHHTTTDRKVVTSRGEPPAIVDVDLDKPRFADQKHIVTSAAIAIDKAQLLTGEATERTEATTTEGDIWSKARDEYGDEMVDELKERRTKAV